MIAHVDLQSVCEQGQQELMATRYLAAEQTLARAEQLALEAGDFDLLARLYMPLQEARRQRRQRCGEGIVRLDLMANSEWDRLDAHEIVERYPHGQLLVAGWGSIDVALQVRELASQHGLYLETFLAAAFPVSDERDESRHVVVIVPGTRPALPSPTPRSLDQLLSLLPPHSIVIPDSGLMSGQRRGDDETYAQTMSLWERLHAPFVRSGDLASDPREKIELYRRAIDVDYACEFAHQRLSKAARSLVQTQPPA